MRVFLCLIFIFALLDRIVCWEKAKTGLQDAASDLYHDAEVLAADGYEYTKEKFIDAKVAAGEAYDVASKAAKERWTEAEHLAGEKFEDLKVVAADGYDGT